MSELPRAIADQLERDNAFDEFVDAEHGRLEICGQAISPSDALFTDPVKYREACSEWRRQCQCELEDLVMESFPHSVAHCFHRYLRGSPSAKDALSALQDSWEGVIHLLFALTLGELRADDQVVEDAGVDRRWIESQTINDRVETIGRVAEWGLDVLAVAGSVSAHCLTLLHDLNRCRNSAAHRAAMTEAQAQAEVDALAPMVMQVLDELRWLAECEVVRPTGRMRKAEAQLEAFQGHSSAQEYRYRELDRKQRLSFVARPTHQSEVYALLQGKVICLCPVFHWLPPDTSHQSQLAILKKRTQGALVFEIVGRSSEMTLEDENLSNSLHELKRIFVKSGKGAA